MTSNQQRNENSGEAPSPAAPGERTGRRKAEDPHHLKHRELQGILSPESGVGELELADMIEVSAIQSLMEDFYQLAHIPMAIIDVKGKVLVGVGWQPICTKFHRVHPETCRHCIESDTQLTAGVPPGEFKLYKCKNHMWDVATPIMVNGKHLGNVFSGQFFFEDESLDYELFRTQARRYGFDEQAYITALEAVPRLGRKMVERAMAFFIRLAQMLSQSSFNNIKLASSLAERDALTASLRRSEYRQNRAEEIAHLGSWELDLETSRLSWSDEVYRIFGLQPQQFGATYEAFLDAVHPDDRQAVDAAYSGSLREGRDRYEIEHRIIRKDTGEIRVVHEKCEHLRDAAGRIIRSIGMVQEVTELRRHAEELEQIVAARTARLHEVISDLEHFSYAIAHDLRAPLRAMQTFAAAIEEECVGCDRGLSKEYFRRIKVASTRMDQLIRDSLNYSKALRQELPPQRVNLSQLLNDLVETYPNLLPDKADIQIAANLPTVFGNPAALMQCFSNLLGNAVKFTKSGTKPQIRVWAEDTVLADPSAPPIVRVWVADNGIGIPKDFQHRLFGLFQRGTKEHEGTGIGLAIVRKVVGHMGGSVGVESEEGRGSSFWVELRRA